MSGVGEKLVLGGAGAGVAGIASLAWSQHAASLERLATRLSPGQVVGRRPAGPPEVVRVYQGAYWQAYNRMDLLSRRAGYFRWAARGCAVLSGGMLLYCGWQILKTFRER